MKRFLSYGLLITALVAHVVMIKTRVPATDACMQTKLFAGTHNADSSPEDGCFFIMPDTPFTSAGLNNISNSRVPVSFIKTVNNPYDTQKSCFSNLTDRQIHITKSTFFLHYSKKEKDGYYIYALRKLLI
ncbi:MAG: hypothetical protein LBS79_03885 [Tannerella sp.]|jgi:hypothetical protein|nr:hypothetical protein [Tannerella sp.]